MKNRKILVFLWVCVAAAFVLTGCVKTGTGIKLPETIPESFKIVGVPWVQQKGRYCGPASAEMVLKYHGMEADQTFLAMADSSNRKGTHYTKLVSHINATYQKSGIRATAVFGSLDLLKKYLAAGLPVIVRQWTSSSHNTRHYRVAYGYDDKAGNVLYHDSSKGFRQSMPYKDFEGLWDVQVSSAKWSTRNLMIVITPVRQGQ